MGIPKIFIDKIYQKKSQTFHLHNKQNDCFQIEF